MILLRLIILLAIVALLMWLLKRLFSDPPQAEKPQQPQQPQVASENMRQCKYCGVHVPESSILRVDDHYYCCQEHADLDQS